MPVVPITRLEFQDKKGARAMRFQRADCTEGKIQDPARIDASLDTIRSVLEHVGSAVLYTHLERPQGAQPGVQSQACCRVSDPSAPAESESLPLIVSATTPAK